MRLQHEFTVDVPLEQAWNAVSGADAVAASVPRAEMRALDGIQAGRIELDPSHGVWGEGRILTIDRDEDEHVATVAFQGRQLNGPGVGSVLLRSQVTRSSDSSSRIELSAEVNSSGHDPGNGFEAAATQLLEQLGERLEQRARELPAPARAPAVEASPAERAVGVASSGSPSAAGKRRSVAVGLGLGAAGALVAVAVVRRRRSAR